MLTNLTTKSQTHIIQFISAQQTNIGWKQYFLLYEIEPLEKWYPRTTEKKSQSGTYLIEMAIKKKMSPILFKHSYFESI